MVTRTNVCFVGGFSLHPLPSSSSSTRSSLSRRLGSGPRTLRRRPLAAPSRTGWRMSDAAATSSSNSLEKFTDLVRGEWIGNEFSFDGETGKLEEIPDGYIPDEMEVWGVTPTGFESNHSSVVRGTRLIRKHTRILPTVDQFADHLDIEEEVLQHDMERDGFTAFECGSYAIAPEKVKARESLLDPVPKAEFVLRDSVVDPERRVVAVVKFDFALGKLINSVQLVQEKWDMDFADGQFVDAVTSYRRGWGTKEPTAPELLQGSWRQRDTGTVRTRAHIPDDTQGEQVVLFPEGIHVVTAKHDSGAMSIEMGWLVGEGLRIAITVSYSPQGDLLHTTRVVEEKI